MASSEELLAIVEKEQAESHKCKHILCVCCSTGCVSSRSEEVAAAFQKEVNDRNLGEQVRVKRVGCMGLCAAGPIVSLEPGETMYKEVKPEDVSEIMDHLGQEPVKRLVFPSSYIPFFTWQEKNILENAGKIDPERIEDYIAVGGYATLLKAITQMSAAEVIQEVVASGLRGRGGAGYPTGIKWQTVAKTNDTTKYVVCNADEGDPGAFMDRNILESDPHLVLEGMAIAAYAVGASKGFIYVRAEYPLAVKRLKIAIRQAKRMDLLGDNIGSTDFSFTVELRLGAGAFVCGEETALLMSIEGKRGAPRPRPPYPAESGLWGHSTLINNVETFANIPGIVADGGKWFARIGTEKSKGTKVFALTGKINNTGLIEVPMGITLRQIVFEIGGGIPDGRKFKAVQTGGPSGGCIPEEFLDTPVDYESLTRLGSMMGSGGMIVIDDTSNMIDIAKFFMDFSREESCGKCVPCRVGTAQLYDMLDSFSAGEATEEDLQTLEELCDLVRNCSLCGLGQTAPNPVITTLRYFRDEYLAKINGNTPNPTLAQSEVHA